MYSSVSLPGSNCTTCHKFYGVPEQDNKCSSCATKSGIALHLRKYNSYRINSYDIFMQTGILSFSDCLIQCVACLEDKICVTKYSCICPYNVCLNCSENIHKCPLCRASKYVQIDSVDIYNYIMACKTHKFNILRWLNHMVAKYQHQLSGIVTIKTFFSNLENICVVIQQLKHQGYYVSETKRYNGDGDKAILLGFIISYIHPTTFYLFNNYGVGHPTDCCLEEGTRQRLCNGYIFSNKIRFKNIYSTFDLEKCYIET